MIYCQFVYIGRIGPQGNPGQPGSAFPGPQGATGHTGRVGPQGIRGELSLLFLYKCKKLGLHRNSAPAEIRPFFQIWLKSSFGQNFGRIWGKWPDLTTHLDRYF